MLTNRTEGDFRGFFLRKTEHACADTAESYALNAVFLGKLKAGEVAGF